jgi:WD40 repeat protein
VTPDGRHVVSGSDDGMINMWDLDAGRLVDTLDDHTAGVRACAVTPDSRHMVSASYDRTLKVWDLETRRVVTTLKGHTDGVRACAIVPDGRRVVSASDDGTLKVWDLDARRLVITLDGHTNGVRACAVTPDGQRVVSASDDGTLEVQDMDARRVVALHGHAAGVRACAVTPDGRHAVSGSVDLTLKVWDLDAGRVIANLEGHTDWVRACAVTPDGRRVISGADDHTLKVWDLETGRLLSTLEGHTNWVRACVVTPDGRRMISASNDRTLKVWDLDNACVLTTLEGHTAGVRGCAVTPDGRIVVSASDDRTLKVWDLRTGDLLTTLVGHAHGVRTCAVTPEGRYVVSASVDRTLKMWELASARCLHTHRGDTTFRCVAATTDTIITGDGAGTVWFLEWPRDLALRQPRPPKAKISASPTKNWPRAEATFPSPSAAQVGRGAVEPDPERDGAMLDHTRDLLDDVLDCCRIDEDRSVAEVTRVRHRGPWGDYARVLHRDGGLGILGAYPGELTIDVLERWVADVHDPFRGRGQPVSKLIIAASKIDPALHAAARARGVEVERMIDFQHVLEPFVENFVPKDCRLTPRPPLTDLTGAEMVDKCLTVEMVQVPVKKPNNNQSIPSARRQYVEVLDRFPIDDFVDLLDGAKRLRILQTFIPMDAHMYSFKDELMRSLGAGCEVHVLLCNPWSPVCQIRQMALGGRHATDIRNEIERNLHFFHDVLERLAGNARPWLKVKVYSTLPSMSIYEIDNIFFCGNYFHGWLAIDSPQIKVTDRESKLGRRLGSELDKVWDKAQAWT